MSNESADKDTGCGCGTGPAVAAYRAVPVVGSIMTPAGTIDKVSRKWRLRDYAGAAAMRLDIGRMNYAVRPGLYAAGEPDRHSPVLVSANYKYSFDVLRGELAGLNAWILVLDTKGVNVWCAAGKGTFGTMEIARRVAETRLPEVVEHRTLVVPQLGAPGVAAHVVKSFCDFEVKYGPVRAADIRQYLAAGMRAGAAMRRVTFPAGERLKVAWLELANALKAGFAATLGILIATALISRSIAPAVVVEKAFPYVAVLWGAVLSGTLLTALLLPYLPGRAFSVKGGILGALVAAATALAVSPAAPALFLASLTLAGAAVSGYLALNYTGCSTFTSPSGVVKEVKAAVPSSACVLALAGLLHLVFLLGGK